MYKAKPLTVFWIAVTVTLQALHAQDVVLPGSTLQGDILRSEGQFLKGMAWYELTAAKARELDVKTAHELDQWNREVGAALVQSPVSDRPSQLWTVRSAGGSLLIINADSGHSINIPRKSNANRQPLIQWTVAEGESNQCWVFHRDRQAFRIASRQNNLVLAAPDNPDADAPIVQLFPRGGDEERWQVVSVSQ
jgi:Ricin-type beta-trefoil lectin domain-like